MLNTLANRQIKLVGLIIIFAQLTLIGQYSQRLDSVMALVNDEPDPFTKGHILDTYDRSLMTHDSIEKWSVTEAFIELGEKTGDISFAADGYARQGIYFITRSDYANGEQKIQKAISIIENEKHVTDEQNYRLANYQNNLAIIQMRTGKTVEAIGNYEAAIKTFSRLEAKSPMASVMSSLAVQYGNIGQYHFAEEYFLKAERIFNDELQQSNLNNTHGLARYYIQQDKYHKAKPYVEKCQELVKNYKDDYYISAIHALVMGYYSAIEDRENAEKEFEKVVEFYEDKEIDDDYIRILLNMANIYDLEKDSDKVEAILSQAENYKINEQDKSLQSLYHRVVADYNFENGNIEEARNLYQTSLSGYLELKEVDKAQQNYLNLFKVEREDGNYEDAIGYMQKYNTIKDSLRSEVVEFGQQVHRIKYETEQKETLITNLSEESERKESRISYLQSIIKSGKAILAGLASIAFLLFYLFWSRSKHNKELQEKNRIIESKSKQNETLLKEIHHRVKNNLQTISSLLYLQSANIDDADAKVAIAEGQHRVESMALIHKNLYQKDNLAGIEIKDYISRLVDNLKQAYTKSDQKVNINLEMENTVMDVDTAIPLGLIINELLTNCFKYAFPNHRNGTIDISFEKKNDEQFELKISDDGIGKETTSAGFGTKLISLLTKQLGAHMTQGNEEGYWTHISR